MPFNGAGTFGGLPPPDYPAVAGNTIRASEFNANMADLFGGLTNAITRDGQSPPTADLPMGARKLTGLGDGAAASDSATYGQLTAAVAAEAALRLSGNYRDIRTFSGIVADGVTDDFVAFQAAIITAQTSNYTIFFPEGVFCKLQFLSAVSNMQMFMHGKVSIKGADAKNCGFVIGKTGSHTPGTHWPLFAIGIASKGAAVDAWVGEIDNVGFVLEAGCGSFERTLHIYEAHDFAVTRNYVDYRATTFPLGQQAAGFVSSNVQPVWASGQSTFWRRGVVSGNVGFASCYYQNAESLGLTNLYDSQIIGNYFEGWVDDMAIHGGVNNFVAYNTNKAVAGRYYFEDVQHLTVLANYLEKVRDPSGAFLVGSGLVGIRVGFSPTYAVNNSVAANQNITISKNHIVMPQGSYTNVAIMTECVQDGLIVEGNIIENQGTGTLDTSTGSLSILQVALLGAWVGPAGNPDAATGGVIRMRNYRIADNICTGTGWSATEGSLGVSAAAGATAVLGPIDVSGNICGSYFVPYANANFLPTNRTLNVSTNGFDNVGITALLRDSRAAFRSILTAGQLLDFANHPASAPATLLDDSGLEFLPNNAGSVRGLRIRVAAAASSSAFCWIRLLRNPVAGVGGTAGVPSVTLVLTSGAGFAVGQRIYANGVDTGQTISVSGGGGAGSYTMSGAITVGAGSTITGSSFNIADQPFSTVSPTTNFVSYLIGLSGLNTTFTAQDKIRIQLYFTAGQLVQITGSVEVFALYHGAS